jgi:hypothetical protein
MKGSGGKKPIGCLSVNAIIATIAVLVVVAGMGIARGAAMFSPGGLNAQTSSQTIGGVASHAQITACSGCHAAPFSARKMADNCLACHTDLQQDPKNFHKIMVSEGYTKGCQECHAEHHGPAASLTLFDLQKFPHALIGYSLQAHQKNADGSPIKCSDCHPGSSTASSYVTYNQAVCAQCHTTIDAAFMPGHIQAYGQKCLNCHDGIDTFGRQFDHARVAFALTGKHATVQCARCHSGEQTIAAMQATAQDCVTCHAKDDVHQGDLGQNCGACHTPADWAQATIDHHITTFPLVGKHQAVACQNCHVNNIFKGTASGCFACHAKDDVHQGDLGQNCVQCHTPLDWKQATIDHAITAFPLVGKHLTVACADCHKNDVFKGTPKDCYTCHVKDDPHDGQLGSDCSLCHTPAGWLPANFDHATTGFALVGKHQSLSCAACHPNNQFKGTRSDCYGCHAKDDAHGGQFGTDCGTCHSPVGWLPANFDHAITGFPLVGKHASAACTSCHVNGVFKGTPKVCAACHAKDDAHNGQFGADCGSCHSPAGWLPATFDHSKSGFPLTGAHTKLSCTQCHTNNVFKGLPADCVSCHSEPAFHQGLFGTNCASCHSTSAWTPAKFSGAHTFPTSHGGASSCTKCHPSNLNSYTCYSCHNQADIAARHQGVANLSDCVRCHANGGGDGGGGGGN